MKLSMWMIVNRLLVLEPELSLHDGEKAEIKGVRFYAAENYALVYADGADVVCKYKDEYFRLYMHCRKENVKSLSAVRLRLLQ